MPRLIGAAQTLTAGTQAQQITTFNSSGTFAAQPRTTNAWVLVLAGGGGGCVGGGSGGGAGGHLEVPSHPLPLSPVPITVGGGGASSNPSDVFPPPAGPYPRNISASNGSNSVLGAAAPLTAIGGGGGRIGVSGTPENGNPGGSGGGGYEGGTGGSATPGQGNPGGDTSPGGYSAGGGGAGAAGQTIGSPVPTTASHGGNGGAGLASSITGSSVTRGGGGGGASYIGPLFSNNGNPNGGLGGSGGGGNAGKVSPTFDNAAGYTNIPAWTAGGVNLGGGGGAQTSFAGSVEPLGAAPGGSGTVIINEPQVDYVDGTSSVWDLKAVFRAVKAGTWTN